MQHTRKRTRGATQYTHVLFRGHTFTRATLQEARSAPDPSRPGFQCRPLNLQAHDVGQFIAAVDEFPRVRQDTAALLRTTGLEGLHARPANAPGPQQSGWLLSHPLHTRRRLRTSCRQSAYCSLSSQWTSSQRRRHVHRFITRRTEADSHRGPRTKFDIGTSKANRSSQREGHAGRGAVQDQGALAAQMSFQDTWGWPRWFSIWMNNWESPEACGPFTNQEFSTLAAENARPTPEIHPVWHFQRSPAYWPD